MRTSGIILDIGNVLVTCNMDNMFGCVVDAGFAPTVHEGFKFMSGIRNLNYIGAIDLDTSIDMFFGHMKKEWGHEIFQKKKEDVVSFWSSPNVIRPNTKILDFLLQLLYRHPNLGIALASNIGIDHYNLMKNLHPFFTNDRLEKFYSFKMGCIKPQINFFNIVTGYLDWCKYPHLGSQRIYVDDLEENRDTAAKFGLTTFAFDSAVDPEEKFIEFIEQQTKEY